MNILIYCPHAFCAPYYETNLEIAQLHLDQGDNVTFLTCNAEMLSCYLNPHHELGTCFSCISRRNAGLALLSPKVKTRSFLNLSAGDKRELATLKTHFRSIRELETLTIEKFDIGYAVLSSLIDHLRNPKPDLETHAPFIKHALISSLATYRSIQNYLSQDTVDKVYVFNGRVACMRAVLRACQSKEVDCLVHDRAQTMHHYSLCVNAMSVDLDYTERMIRENWARAADVPDRDLVASQFYLAKSKAANQDWRPFVKDQKEGLLPADWQTDKKNVVIFNSSDDEFVAIGDDWKNPLYKNQVEGVQRIVESLIPFRDRFHLYLRFHPNLKGVKTEETEAMLNLRSDLLTVIAPEEPISTYALIRAANIVVTFGSTVGIEAVFWGTPSILAGRALYQSLEGTYKPTTHEEVVELIMSALKPKDKTAALAYGYYMNTIGTPFTYYEAHDLEEGLFKGTKVEPGRWARLAVKALRRLPNKARYYLSMLSFYLACKRLTGKLKPD